MTTDLSVKYLKQKNGREFTCHKLSLNFAWFNSPIGFCYFFISWFMKLIVIYVDSSYSLPGIKVI